MIVAGIDAGAQTVKAVLLKDGKVLAQSVVMAGTDTDASAQKALSEAMGTVGLKREDVGKIVATGVGRKDVLIASDNATEITCSAKGAVYLMPSARTVIDVGAEEGRAIRTDKTGRATDFAVNEKCGAGAGAFTQSMAKALEVSLEEFGQLSLRSDREIPMNAQCVVFAESEVVSLIHAGTPKEDIAKAVHDAIADRVSSVVRMVGVENDVALIGGIAKNAGFIDSLKRSLGVDIVTPAVDPQIVGALGAALIAQG